MRHILLHTAFLSLIAISGDAQLTLLSTFDPMETSVLCGIGYDPDSSHVWVYDCSDSQIHCYTTDGTYVKSFNRPGEAADDVDFDFSSENFTMDDSSIDAFDILFINGETDNAEVYAIDRTSGEVIDTLHTQFGVSHIVGGSWHHIRNTFFLVQDNVPDVDQENTVAEVNPITGEVLQSFQTTDNFTVNYGDLEVCTVSGNLFIVSSQESSIAEYTPDGAFVQSLTLPVGVNSLSGIAMDYTAGTAWVSSTNGSVYLIGGVNCTCSSTSATIDATTCDIYVSPSGEYTWGQDGTYQDVLLNSTGCDSLITINLDVIEIDNGVTLDGGTLTSAQPGAEYQWYDCDNKFSPIPDATSQSYTPVESGNFAIVVSFNECSVTSECVFADPSGIEEKMFVQNLKVFPNPANNAVLISFSLESGSELRFDLLDVLGNKVSESSTKAFGPGNQNQEIDLSSLAKGMYVLKITSDQTITSLNILKK